MPDKERFELVDMSYQRGMGDRRACITVLLKVDGVQFTGAGRVVGPVNATYAAINDALNLAHEAMILPAKLVRFTLSADDEGADADALTKVTVQNAHLPGFIGQGKSDDTIESAAIAYINALNELAHAMLSAPGD